MIKIGNRYFNLKIIRKRNKNIYLRIKGDTLEVTCPSWVSKQEIIDFVLSKEDWINKTIEKKENQIKDSKIIIGDYIYYLGKKYEFNYFKGKDDFKIVEDKIIIHCKDGTIDEAINTFYKCNKKVILEMIYQMQDKYLDILKDYNYNLIPEYKIKLIKSAWGINYNKKNLIVINERLIHFEPRCLEAILWHELLHFMIPNHSNRFHEVLALYMPDYKEIVKKLF